MSKELSIKKLETIAVDALEDIKGRDIIVVNTTKLSQMFERIVLASGESNRQVRSLARHVADKVREAGGEVLSTEGEETGEWVLVVRGSSARQAKSTQSTPVDMSIVGVVDEVVIKGKVAYHK